MYKILAIHGFQDIPLYESYANIDFWNPEENVCEMV
jgi:hypothetical protein